MTLKLQQIVKEEKGHIFWCNSNDLHLVSNGSCLIYIYIYINQGYTQIEGYDHSDLQINVFNSSIYSFGGLFIPYDFSLNINVFHTVWIGLFELVYCYEFL